MLAAWLIIATPVMACCVTGHMDESAISLSAETSTLPPCHQTQILDNQSTDTDQMPEKYCPSCDDCAFSQPDHGDYVPVITAEADPEFIAFAQKSGNMVPADLGLPDSTAPPRRQSLPVDKPLFATDSLLI